MEEEIEPLKLGNWDWRAFARLVAWALIAALWAHSRDAAVLPRAAALLRNAALLSLLSFGVFTYLFSLAAMGAVRAAFFFDETAYALSERLVRPIAGGAPFAIQFWTAFSAEIVLVLGSAWAWRAWDLGPRLMTALMEISR